MIGMKNYMNAYVDRRMKSVVEEWDLSRKDDVADFTARLDAIEQEIPRLKESKKASVEKLTELETRARKLKEKI
jgi:polyhydroxyalkanoate synthesis regulator phasin